MRIPFDLQISLNAPRQKSNYGMFSSGSDTANKCEAIESKKCGMMKKVKIQTGKAVFRSLGRFLTSPIVLVHKPAPFRGCGPIFINNLSRLAIINLRGVIYLNGGRGCDD